MNRHSSNPHTQNAKSLTLKIVHRTWPEEASKLPTQPKEITVEVTDAGQEIVLVGIVDKYLMQVVQADAEHITLIVNGVGLRQGEQRAIHAIELAGCKAPHQFRVSAGEMGVLRADPEGVTRQTPATVRFLVLRGAALKKLSLSDA